MKIVATTSLPAVDHPYADRWNAPRACQLLFFRSCHRRSPINWGTNYMWHYSFSNLSKSLLSSWIIFCLIPLFFSICGILKIDQKHSVKCASFLFNQWLKQSSEYKTLTSFLFFWFVDFFRGMKISSWRFFNSPSRVAFKNILFFYCLVKFWLK